MSLSLSSALVLQAAVLVGGVGLLALTPPAQGDLLLVPLSPSAAERLAPVALAHGARLVARGPLPASLVVRGRRAELWRTLAGIGVLVVAAPALLCGAGGPARG